MAVRLDSSEVRDWADRGWVREIVTHRRAIVLHVRAARLFEGQGDSVSAVQCGHRAQRARNKLVKALVKQQVRLVRRPMPACANDLATPGHFLDRRGEDGALAPPAAGLRREAAP